MKQKKFCIKNLIIKLITCIMVSFLAFTAYIVPAKDNYIVHADTYTPVQKQSFITWLMSYFGINIYTDAQQISDDVYSAVKMAYELYLQTLQPAQQVPFDKLFDGISWDNATPNTLKLTGWVFNALKGFANYVNSQVYDPSNVEGLNIGSFEYTQSGTYIALSANVPIHVVESASWGNFWYMTDSDDVRYVQFRKSNNRCAVYAVSLTPYKYRIQSSPNVNTPTDNPTKSYYQGVDFYYNYISLYSTPDDFYDKTFNPYLSAFDGLEDYRIAYIWAYGAYSQDGSVVLNDVFALPQQGVLDDLIGATDPKDDVQLDLSQSDINISILQSLADLVDQVNALTDSYVLDDSWPETIGKVIAQSVAIDNELTDVDYPNAIDWEVPEPIATPQLIPLIQPDCPDLSACLVAGIQDVGQSLGNVIESNSNVSNYVSVILFMGIALSILGGI